MILPNGNIGQMHTLYFKLIIILLPSLRLTQGRLLRAVPINGTLKDMSIHELHKFPRKYSFAVFSWNKIRVNSSNSWMHEN